MSKYRNNLPQLENEKLFITDGGLETTLVFVHGYELPEFAAFTLLEDPAGSQVFKDYLEPYLKSAQNGGHGFVLESPTWRASPDWTNKLGYTADQFVEINRRSIALMEEIRTTRETSACPIVVSGCIGPRGDGYDPSVQMDAQEAERYHAQQINVLRDTTADMICAMTLNYQEEAIGITRAARAAAMPVALSFTVETDGALPTGQSLGEAIQAVDAATNAAPAYYMINCAHPTHFGSVLAAAAGEPWLDRIKGVRGNASTKSHAELDESVELDDGNPLEFGQQNTALMKQLHQLAVIGGCCGTDHRHIEAICQSLANN